MKENQKEKPKLITSPLHFIIAIIILLAIFFFFQSFLLKSYRIPSESMASTIDAGDRIIVDRFAYRFNDPERGDVVVFKAPKGAAEGVSGCLPPLGSVCLRDGGGDGDVFIKRIVAKGGDRISLRRGKLFLNGKEVYQQFSCGENNPSCHFPNTVTIPKNHYFLLGDNRSDSFDSRFWGTIISDNIIGKARVVYWPPKNFGILE